MTDKETPDGVIESAIEDETRQTEGAAELTSAGSDDEPQPPNPA